MDEKILNLLMDMKQDIQSMKQDIQDMKQDIQTLKTQNTRIQLTLENEVMFGIKAVADGHSDLMRFSSWHGHGIEKLSIDVEQLKVNHMQLSAELRKLQSDRAS